VSLTHPVAPLRVVIAEDAVLLREGLRRLLTETGLDARLRPGTRPACFISSVPCARISCSLTSGCRRPRPLRACGLR
jgi:hypothetical protein